MQIKEHDYSKSFAMEVCVCLMLTKVNLKSWFEIYSVIWVKQEIQVFKSSFGHISETAAKVCWKKQSIVHYQ